MPTSRNLNTVVLVINEFRKVSPDLPAQTMLTLLEIGKASPDGISMADLGQRTGLTQSSVSRNVSALSRVGRKGKPGADLVRRDEDPLDRRNKIVALTAKGNRLITAIEGIVGA